jgi:uncharacterized protein (UPF0548 family)
VFYLLKPGDRQVEGFRSKAAGTDFSYAAVGTTRTEKLPAGYVVDRNRIELGSGREIFDKAVAALLRWDMFDLGWVKLLSQKSPQEGLVVVIRSAHMGFWSLNACRVVYVIDEREGTAGGGEEKTGSPFKAGSPFKEGTVTFGFGYGTLRDHAESGEERFLIQWDKSTDAVSYDILAFSKPANIIVGLGYRVARSMQLRFARDSKAAMQRAVH